MADTRSIDPIAQRFRAALDAICGNRLDRVVLFGSRARGDARADLDYDIAVFLKDMSDWWTEVKRLARIHDEFLEHDAFIDAKPHHAAFYSARTPLMREIRRDGIDL